MSISHEILAHHLANFWNLKSYAHPLCNFWNLTLQHIRRLINLVIYLNLICSIYEIKIYYRVWTLHAFCNELIAWSSISIFEYTSERRHKYLDSIVNQFKLSAKKYIHILIIHKTRSNISKVVYAIQRSYSACYYVC